MFTRYIVTPYPSWKKGWGIWDRLNEEWYEHELARHEAHRLVAFLNA